MNRSTGLCLTLLLPALLVGACRAPQRRGAPPPAPPSTPPSAAHPATVTALRYRTFVHEGDSWNRGGGWWIQELYVPAHGVCANVAFELDTSELKVGEVVKEWKYKTTMNAFRGEIRNRSADSVHKTPEEQPTEKVEVPWDLAQRIVAMAQLEERRRAEALVLGGQSASDGLLRDLASEGR